MSEVVSFVGGPLDGDIRVVAEGRRVFEIDTWDGPYGYDGGVVDSHRVTYVRPEGTSTFILKG